MTRGSLLCERRSSSIASTLPLAPGRALMRRWLPTASVPKEVPSRSVSALTWIVMPGRPASVSEPAPMVAMSPSKRRLSRNDTLTAVITPLLIGPSASSWLRRIVASL
jgi:histidinol dehydrogenase